MLKEKKRSTSFLLLTLALLIVAGGVGLFHLLKDEAEGESRVHYPTRTEVIIEEIEDLVENIKRGDDDGTAFSEIIESMESANCENMNSICDTGNCDPMEDEFLPGSFWDAKEKEKEFIAKQEDIRKNKEHFAFLQNIIKKELAQEDGGLRMELENMREEGQEEKADSMEEDLEVLLFIMDPEDEETQEIISEESVTKGEQRMESWGIDMGIMDIMDKFLSFDYWGDACISACETDWWFEFCVGLQVVQESIDLIFEMELGLEDMEIDPVEISSIDLNLPGEIDIPDPKLSFEIPIPDIGVSFPQATIAEVGAGGALDMSINPIELPSVRIPTPIRERTELCPQYESPASAGSFERHEMQERIGTVALDWHLQVYSYLAQRCMEIPSAAFTRMYCQDIEDEGGVASVISECDTKDAEDLEEDYDSRNICSFAISADHVFDACRDNEDAKGCDRVLDALAEGNEKYACTVALQETSVAGEGSPTEGTILREMTMDERCFDPDELVPTINNTCEYIWSEYSETWMFTDIFREMDRVDLLFIDDYEEWYDFFEWLENYPLNIGPSYSQLEWEKVFFDVSTGTITSYKNNFSTWNSNIEWVEVRTEEECETDEYGNEHCEEFSVGYYDPWHPDQYSNWREALEGEEGAVPFEAKLESIWHEFPDSGSVQTWGSSLPSGSGRRYESGYSYRQFDKDIPGSIISAINEFLSEDIEDMFEFVFEEEIGIYADDKTSWALFFDFVDEDFDEEDEGFNLEKIWEELFELMDERPDIRGGIVREDKFGQYELHRFLKEEEVKEEDLTEEFEDYTDIYPLPQEILVPPRICQEVGVIEEVEEEIDIEIDEKWQEHQMYNYYLIDFFGNYFIPFVNTAALSMDLADKFSDLYDIIDDKYERLSFVNSYGIYKFLSENELINESFDNLPDSAVEYEDYDIPESDYDIPDNFYECRAEGGSEDDCEEYAIPHQEYMDEYYNATGGVGHEADQDERMFHFIENYENWEGYAEYLNLWDDYVEILKDMGTSEFGLFDRYSSHAGNWSEYEKFFEYLTTSSPGIFEEYSEYANNWSDYEDFFLEENEEGDEEKGELWDAYEDFIDEDKEYPDNLIEFIVTAEQWESFLVFVEEENLMDENYDFLIDENRLSASEVQDIEDDAEENLLSIIEDRGYFPLFENFLAENSHLLKDVPEFLIEEQLTPQEMQDENIDSGDMFNQFAYLIIGEDPLYEYLEFLSRHDISSLSRLSGYEEDAEEWHIGPFGEPYQESLFEIWQEEEPSEPPMDIPPYKNEIPFLPTPVDVCDIVEDEYPPGEPTCQEVVAVQEEYVEMMMEYLRVYWQEQIVFDDRLNQFGFYEIWEKFLEFLSINKLWDEFLVQAEDDWYIRNSGLNSSLRFLDDQREFENFVNYMKNPDAEIYPRTYSMTREDLLWRKAGIGGGFYGSMHGYWHAWHGDYWDRIWVQEILDNPRAPRQLETFWEEDELWFRMWEDYEAVQPSPIHDPSLQLEEDADIGNVHLFEAFHKTVIDYGIKTDEVFNLELDDGKSESVMDMTKKDYRAPTYKTHLMRMEEGYEALRDNLSWWEFGLDPKLRIAAKERFTIDMMDKLVPARSEEKAIARACTDLYLNRGETPPASCENSPLSALRSKCKAVLHEEEERDPALRVRMPQPCAILPLFENYLDVLVDEFDPSIGGGMVSRGGGELTGYPSEGSFTGCGSVSGSVPGAPEIPEIPVIPLSDYSVEIPDIETPNFGLSGILEVTLPDVIIEDLTFPDIELCDLSDCQDFLDIFPSIIELIPSLENIYIPTPAIVPNPLTLDSATAQVSGHGAITVPLPDVHIGEVNLPSVLLDIPQLPEITPISISSPEYDLPSLEIPEPYVEFNWGGFDVDVGSAIVGAILNYFGFSGGSLCASAGGVNFLPLSIGFEDYHVQWPDFPKIPEIPLCRNARQFCRDAANSLQDVIDELEEIMREVEEEIQEALSMPADATAKLEDLINEEVQDLEDSVNNYIQSTHIEGELIGETIRLDSYTIPTEDIEIDVYLSDLIEDMPSSVEVLDEEDRTVELTNPIEIEMPTIPLDDLSTTWEYIVELPALQGIDGGAEFDWGECEIGPVEYDDVYDWEPFELEGIEIEVETF